MNVCYLKNVWMLISLRDIVLLDYSCQFAVEFVKLLRCNGSPGCFDSGLQVICIVRSGVSHLPLDNTP